MGGIGRGQGSDELLAAIAGQQIVTPLQAASKNGGDRLQALISFRVAIGVIEALEVVDIDHENGQAKTLAPRAAVGRAKRFIEAASVAQAGQWITPCQFFQLVALALDLHRLSTLRRA